MLLTTSVTSGLTRTQDSKDLLYHRLVYLYNETYHHALVRIGQPKVVFLQEVEVFCHLVKKHLSLVVFLKHNKQCKSVLFIHTYIDSGRLRNSHIFDAYTCLYYTYEAHGF